MKKVSYLTSLCFLIGMLNGCTTSEFVQAPIYDRDELSVSSISETGEKYKVKPGDTLYSIAVKHGCNPMELARLNGITDPSQVKVGLVLKLTTEKNYPVSEIAKEEKVEETTPEVVAESEIKKPEVEIREESSNALSLENVSFSWPTNPKNEILRKFGEGDCKGIEIAGKMGENIYAAAAGRVIFVGNNVKGYGNLIIISHCPGVVTVYGHNSDILVKKGQNVKKGYKIAHMGSSDSKDVNLLFEIRYKNKPVNPSEYLPD